MLSYTLREGLTFGENHNFPQVSFLMNDRMTNQALDLLDRRLMIRSSMHLALVFALPIAKSVTSVLGLESVEASVKGQEECQRNAVSMRCSKSRIFM